MRSGPLSPSNVSRESPSDESGPDGFALVLVIAFVLGALFVLLYLM